MLSQLTALSLSLSLVQNVLFSHDLVFTPSFIYYVLKLGFPPTLYWNSKIELNRVLPYFPSSNNLWVEMFGMLTYKAELSHHLQLYKRSLQQSRKVVKVVRKKKHITYQQD